MVKKSKRAASESSDDEAPEAVSFGSSKKTAKGERSAVQHFHAAEKQKKKEKNRAVDRALKERSAKGKGKARYLAENVASSEEEEGAGSDEGDGPGRRDLEARMARAMMDAEDEDDEDSEAEGSDFEGLSGEDVDMKGGEDESQDEEDDMLDEEEDLDEDDDEEAEEDEEMGFGSNDEDEDEEEVHVPAKPPSSSKRNYLPDHLFKSALSSAPSKSSKIVFDDTSRPSPPSSKQQKRKRRKQSSKDIILGSRTIRTLPKANVVSSPVVAKGLARPRRVEKFMRTSLNLKGDPLKSRTKGWTRKSANLGVMKRNGPAANFVRNM